MNYSKGYQAWLKRSWPQHRSPIPPEPVLSLYMQAANALRDAADGLCATISEDDEFHKELAPKIDAFDAANRALTGWLLTGNPPPG